MELQPGDLIQVLNSGNNCVVLKVLDAAQFNANNVSSLLVWDSFSKINRKIWIKKLWSPSAMEACWRTGKIAPYLPEIHYLGEWCESTRGGKNFRYGETGSGVVALMDIRKMND